MSRRYKIQSPRSLTNLKILLPTVRKQAWHTDIKVFNGRRNNMHRSGNKKHTMIITLKCSRQPICRIIHAAPVCSSQPPSLCTQIAPSNLYFQFWFSRAGLKFFPSAKIKVSQFFSFLRESQHSNSYKSDATVTLERKINELRWVKIPGSK